LPQPFDVARADAISCALRLLKRRVGAPACASLAAAPAVLGAATSGWAWPRWARGHGLCGSGWAARRRIAGDGGADFPPPLVAAVTPGAVAVLTMRYPGVGRGGFDVGDAGASRFLLAAAAVARCIQPAAALRAAATGVGAVDGDAAMPPLVWCRWGGTGGWRRCCLRALLFLACCCDSVGAPP